MAQFRPSGFGFLPPVIKNLLLLNGTMWVLSIILARTASHIDLTDVLGLHFFASDKFKPYQLVTHMFMHAYYDPDTGGIYIWHILSNMFALWMFGSVIESVWGPKRFLFFYIACGLGGAFAHLGVSAWTYHEIAADVNSYQLHPNPSDFFALMQQHANVLSEGYIKSINDFYNSWRLNPSDSSMIETSKQMALIPLTSFADIPIVGASGAVFGVLVAFGMLFPNQYVYFFALVPIKAKYFVFGYAALELISGIEGSQDGIAHFAHIGGALVGFLLVKYWNRNLRKDFF